MTDDAPLGVIDIGTHSVLLLVAGIEQDGSLSVLEDRAEISRLGEGLESGESLSIDAMDRTFRVLQDYRESCDRLGVGRIIAVGTSALRRAVNADAFIERVRLGLGFSIRVIEGQEEARLTFLSAADGMADDTAGHLVVDIGGGSTEFIAGRGRDMVDLRSVDLGSVGMTEQYLRSDPPTEAEVLAMSSSVEAQIRNLPEWDGIDQVTGIAGTVTTLAAIEKSMEAYDPERIEGMRLSMSALENQIRMFRAMPLEQRKKIPGLRPERAEVILAGAEILRQTMIRFGVDDVFVSTKGVRYGIILEMVDPNPHPIEVDGP